VSEDDLRKPMEFFPPGQRGRAPGFEAGIENALCAILVSPRFLIRVEQDPTGLAPGTAYKSATLPSRRGSRFSSGAAFRMTVARCRGGGEAPPAEVLEAQVRRMLAIRARAASSRILPRSGCTLARSNQSSRTPAGSSISTTISGRGCGRKRNSSSRASCAKIASVMDLISADYTFVNERLAKHYEIPYIYGSQFRRVSFAGDPARQRGGLLRQGSILTVTSYATRTSPVIAQMDSRQPARHATPAGAARCAGARWQTRRFRPNCPCANDSPPSRPVRNARAATISMDPVGFSLENFDAVGHWRTNGGEQAGRQHGRLPRMAASLPASRGSSRRC